MRIDLRVDRLTALYDAEVDRVYGFVRNRVGRDAAGDIVSEVFHAAALAVRAGDDVSLSPAWLMAVARNKVNDHWRRSYRAEAKQHLTHARPSDMTTFPHDWAEDARRPAVIDALDRLPDRDRMLLVVHHVDGLPISELADLTGTSVRATESALARARRRFRSCYDEGVNDV